MSFGSRGVRGVRSIQGAREVRGIQGVRGVQGIWCIRGVRDARGVWGEGRKGCGERAARDVRGHARCQRNNVLLLTSPVGNYT